MTIPKTPKVESELIKKGRAAAKRKKENPGDLSKSRSANAKKSSSNIAEHRANMTPEQIETTNAKQRKPNLKPSQIAEMEALWESGEVTLKELAERFSRDQAIVSRHMTLNNIIKGSKAEEYSRLIREKIALELSGEPGENAKRIKAAKEEHLKYLNLINKLTWNEFAVVNQKKLPLQSIFPNLKALKEAMTIFALTRQEAWSLLGVLEFEQKHVEDDIPELLVSELTGEDIEKMRIDQLQAANLTGESMPIEIEVIGMSDNDIIEEDEQ